MSEWYYSDYERNRLGPVAARDLAGDWRASPYGNAEGDDLSRFRGAAAGRNVLVVHLESTAAQYLAPYGADLDPMPNLSRLARSALLFERAVRFHDMGGIRPLHEKVIGEQKAGWFIGTNFRMSEFTGGVMLAQLRKLDTIVGAVRANARRVYEGVRDLPGIRFRHLPDPDGELGAGVFIGFQSKEQRDRYIAAMKAEGVPARPPGGSVILPTLPHIMNKVTASPNWPSFTSERGKAMKYGPETCPRKIDILNRFAGVPMDPKYTKRDLDDVVAAIRKVYPAAVKA